jgi:hypothetical protein
MAEAMTDPLARRFSREVEQLFKEEGIDDPGELVATPSWEEYPTFSRFQRIEFLDSLKAIERSYVLFAHALAYLDRIVERACALLEPAAQREFVAVVSIQDWQDLSSVDPMPPVPSFFVCTQSSSIVKHGKMLGVHSPQAGIVAGWLERLGQTDRWDIAQSKPGGDPDLFRVYVGERVLPCAGLLTLRDISADG